MTDVDAAKNASKSKIDPELLQQLEDLSSNSNSTGAPVPVTMLISMKAPISKVTDDFNKSTTTYATRGDRLTALNTALIDFTKNSQKNILSFLETEKETRDRDGDGDTSNGDASELKLKFESLWISNMIIIKNGDLKLARALEHFDEIDKISPNRQIQLLQ